MVRADEGGAACASDVDADKRHAPRCEVGDQRIVVVDADQNGCIEAMLRACVGRLKQEWVEARLRKPSRDRREHHSKEEERQVAMPGIVADDDADEPCLVGHQRACSRIGGVADGTRHLADALTGLVAHVAFVVQRARNGRDRDSCLFCDILDRWSAAHDGNDTAQWPRCRAKRANARPPHVEVVDTVGSGDSFGAALVASLHEQDALASTPPARSTTRCSRSGVFLRSAWPRSRRGEPARPRPRAQRSTPISPSVFKPYGDDQPREVLSCDGEVPLQVGGAAGEVAGQAAGDEVAIGAECRERPS